MYSAIGMVIERDYVMVERKRLLRKPCRSQDAPLLKRR